MNRRVVSRSDKALPVAFSFRGDRPDNNRAAADDFGPGNAASQRVLDQPAADPLPGIAMINKLSDQEAGDWVRGRPVRIARGAPLGWITLGARP